MKKCPVSMATPLQIEGGGTLHLSIVFSPELEGAHDETLTINSSDPNQPVQTIHLSGLGTADVTGLPEDYQGMLDVELSVSPNPYSDRLLIS